MSCGTVVCPLSVKVEIDMHQFYHVTLHYRKH